MNWVKTKREYGPHCLEFEFRLPDGTIFKSSTRPLEGCIHLWRIEGHNEDNDYMHICNLDDFIAMLTQLKEQLK